MSDLNLLEWVERSTRAILPNEVTSRGRHLLYSIRTVSRTPPPPPPPGTTVVQLLESDPTRRKANQQRCLHVCIVWLT